MKGEKNKFKINRIKRPAVSLCEALHVVFIHRIVVFVDFFLCVVYINFCFVLLK